MGVAEPGWPSGGLRGLEDKAFKEEGLLSAKEDGGGGEKGNRKGKPKPALIPLSLPTWGQLQTKGFPLNIIISFAPAVPSSYKGDSADPFPTVAEEENCPRV